MGTGLVNGSFETGDLSGWTWQNGDGGGGAGSYSVGTSYAHSGSPGTYGCFLNSTGAEYGYVAIQQDVTASSTGAAQNLWLNITNCPDGHVRIQFMDDNSYFCYVDYTTTGGGWVQVDLHKDAYLKLTGNWNISVQCVGTSTQCYVDNHVVGTQTMDKITKGMQYVIWEDKRLVNSSFETGDLTGWTKNDNGGTYTVGTSTVHDGTYSLYCSNISPDYYNEGVYQNVQAQVEGGAYVWVYLTAANYCCRLTVTGSDTYPHYVETSTTGSWVQLVADLTTNGGIPRTGSWKVECIMMTYGSGPTSGYIDDFLVGREQTTITKAMEYVIYHNYQTKTKGLTYAVITHPSAITKGMEYVINLKTYLLTKDMTWVVRHNKAKLWRNFPSDRLTDWNDHMVELPLIYTGYNIAQHIQYEQFFDGAGTWGLYARMAYTVLKPHVKQKTLTYAVPTGTTTHNLTKGMAYSIKRTPSALTKTLGYSVKTTKSAITKTMAYNYHKVTSMTKGLAYLVRKTHAAITEGLAYQVKTTPSAKTKTLIYNIKKSYPLTKGMVYAVRYTHSAITKGDVYAVQSTHSAITKGLQYIVRFTHSAITDALAYKVKSTPSALTKGLTYNVNATSSHQLTKGMVYLVRSTHSAITKGLAYNWGKTTALTKTLAYVVKFSSNPSKALVYRVIKTYPLTKGLAYSVKTVHAPTKGLIYRVNKTYPITKGMAYNWHLVSTKTKTLAYIVKSTHNITKGLGYWVEFIPGVLPLTLTYKVRKAHAAITKGLQYTVPTTHSTTKGLSYVVKSTHSKTEALTYRVRFVTDLTLGMGYYLIKTVSAITKALGYKVDRELSSTKGLDYQVDSEVLITKGLLYEARQPVTTYVLELGLVYRVAYPQGFTLGLTYDTVPAIYENVVGDSRITKVISVDSQTSLIISNNSTITITVVGTDKLL
jgi:hypothetical protein